VGAEVDRVRLWTQVLTGMELDAHNALRPLDVPTWLQRRRQLEPESGRAG
jgi:hypothetical protein